MNHLLQRQCGRPGAHRRPAPAHRLPKLAAFAIAAALGAFCGHPGWAQQPQGPRLTPNYRDADIRVVADQVQQVIGRPVIIDPRVRAQVTILSNASMTPEAFYRLFQSALEVHGFVALDSGDAIQIVPDANARFGSGSDYVTQAIMLENIAAAQLVPILRPLLPQSAHLAAHATSNSLIVADRPQNIQRVLSLIRRMDQAGTEDVDVVPLENASADEVVRMLSSLNQAAQAAGGTPPIQVIADTRTNSVLLAGTGPSRLRYKALIAHLDTPTAQGGNTLVRYLNYADAEDLATKLQAQFGASGGGGGGGGAGAKPAAGAEAAGANTGPVTIWADAGTNALVINAPERIRQDMLAVVNQIDIPRLQVQVDAIIVEITESKAAQIGTTWLLNGAAGDKALGVTNFSSTTGSITQLATPSGTTTAPSAASIPQGITAAIGRLRDGGTSWAALLNALRGDADTNVVSTPQIVTLDNEEAEIKVGQQVPFVTGQFTNTGSASVGTVNPFQTIQRQEVGTKLKITPQINEGNGVKLKIEQETSSISAGATGAVDLVTNNRTITTSVFVHDGDMLILGGLIDDQMRNNEQRVPGLGRIPGLGWLFRARKTERSKTNLMVFIRPVILHDEADSRFQTNAKYRYVQELQREMNDSNKPLIRNGDRPEVPPFPEPAPERPKVAPAPTPPATDGSESR
ncbi:MAG TPA: type II secretion system secretin GspD [Gammaproteobacteria bacterium]|nr:type II secretion system secretin GspD [Gammaproteobacteria bacterium]